MRSHPGILVAALLLGLAGPPDGYPESSPEALGEWIDDLEALSREGRVGELGAELEALDVEAERAEPEDAARLQLLRARHRALSGELKEALDILDELLDESPPEALRLQAYSLAANTAMVARFYTRAFEYLLPGLRLLEEVDDPVARAAILGRASYIYERLGDLDNALGFAEGALAAARATGDPRELCVEGYQLAVVEQESGLSARGAITLGETAFACEAASDHLFLGLVRNRQSMVELEFGNPEEALELANTALERYEHSGYNHLAVAATQSRAEALLALGEPEQALQELNRAYAQYRSDFTNDDEGSHWDLTAASHEARGDYAAALEATRRAERAWEAYHQQTHRLRRAQAEVEFETARRDRQLAVAEERSRRNEIMRNAAVGGGVGLILLVLLLLSRYYNQVRANRDIAGKNAELATLNRIVSAINSREDFDEVMAVLMQQAVELLPEADRGLILVRDENSGYFRVAGTYPPMDPDCLAAEEFPQTELTEDLALPRYTEQGERLADGIFRHVGFRPAMDHELLTRSRREMDLIVIVLPVQEQVEGFLLLASEHRRDPTGTGQARRLERIREHAIAAITRARHLATMRQENRRAEQALDNLRDAHEQLKQALGNAERANTAKTEFLARASHELRTPLNTIIGYSQKLARRLEQEGIDDTVPEAHSIRESGRHLLSIIEEVLNLSRAESGDTEIKHEEIDLAGLLEQIAETMRPQVEEAGNRLETACAPEVGRLQSDPVKLRQILFNLLDNANKFTEGGVIRLIAEADDEAGQADDPAAAPSLRIRVTDTGVGMSPEEMERVFYPFTQGNDDIARAYGGSGLGLAVSRSLAELLGGSLEVHSEPGRGSDFRLLLPRHVLPLMEIEATDQPPAAPESPAGAGLRGMHVLVIEDNRINREMLSEYLELEGLQVTGAGDGPEGLERARRQRPDLVLMDLSLPSMSGSEATRLLRQDPQTRDIPVIAVSAYATREAEERAREMGCDDFETKPVDFDRLLGRMRQLLQRESPGY